MNNEPVLAAFECSMTSGRYNVWRYCLPHTECIYSSMKADSKEDAISKALLKIKGDL